MKGVTNNDPLRVAFVGNAHVHTPDYLAVCARCDWIENVGLAVSDPATRDLLPNDVPYFDRVAALPHHDLAVVMGDAADHDTLCPTLLAPALFIEKPLAVTGERAARLASALNRAGKDVWTGFFLRHAPAVDTCKSVLASGRIGHLQHARLTFAHPGLKEGWLQNWPAHSNPARMGGGVFADLAIHLVDIAEMLVGALSPHACQLDPGTPDTGGQARLHSQENATVELVTSAMASRVMLEFVFVGDKGTLTLDLGRVTLRQNSGEHVLHDGPMTIPADGFETAMRAAHAKQNGEDLECAVWASERMEQLIALA